MQKFKLGVKKLRPIHACEIQMKWDKKENAWFSTHILKKVPTVEGEESKYSRESTICPTLCGEKTPIKSPVNLLDYLLIKKE